MYRCRDFSKTVSIFSTEQEETLVQYLNYYLKGISLKVIKNLSKMHVNTIFVFLKANILIP